MENKIIVGVIIIVLLYKFVIKFLIRYVRETRIDKEELKDQNIYDKFSILIDGLNEYCYSNNGKVTIFDDANANVYAVGSNQIVLFQYNVGMLTIEWKYKHYQREMIYRRSFPNIGNVTKEGLNGVLKLVIEEFNEKLKIHKNS